MTYAATAEYALDHEPTTGDVDALQAALRTDGAVTITVDSAHQRLTAAFEVAAGTVAEAIAAAAELAAAATPTGGMLSALDVCDVATLKIRAERVVPELVGKAGAAAILGVSRQALDQRIAADSSFPRSYDVDGRHVFVRAAVEAYNASYVRRPPGPAKGTARPRRSAG